MTENSETVIVTGSSSGIGYDIAKTFLKQGANVVLNGRDPGRLKEAEARLGVPGSVAAVVGDIGAATTSQALVDLAVSRFGGVDVLVNNAGEFAPKAFVDVTEGELMRYLEGNLKGTYLVTQAVVRQLKRQGRGGSIINIGTVLIDHAIAGFPATAPLVSKGGVHALTTSLAAELSADGIRVNLVAPGIIRTPLHQGDVDALGGLALMKRVGEVEEISAAVVYLAEAEFITGHVLPVDGGFVAGRA